MIDISLSKSEFLFMREAMKEKFQSLMEDLDEAKEESEKKSRFTLSPQQVQAMKDSGVWNDFEKRAQVIRQLMAASVQKHAGEQFDKEYQHSWKPVQQEEIQKPKKPHWTQTPEGKKILAKRKRSKK